MPALKALLKRSLEILYPRRCPLCDGALKRSEGLVCEACIPKVKFIQGRTCNVCGNVLKSLYEEVCADCAARDRAFEAAASPFAYTALIRASLKRFKYRGRAEYAGFYAACIYSFAKDRLRLWRADALIPVPVHKSRLADRGYNQAGLIADELGKLAGIPVRSDLVARRKKTAVQNSLAPLERRKNLQSAFSYIADEPCPETVIIIDDIFTTGSTVEAMAELLKEHGAGRIFVLTLSNS